MRLPTLDGQRNSTNIDEAEAIRMIRHAVDNGVNYLDTAYPYHGGQSEIVVGKALRDGYRQRVKLATKLPTWLVNAPDDFDRILDEQLKKLQTASIDFYLFHALNKENWNNVVLRHNLLAKAEAALADGRIRHIGFSFHGDYDAFAEILNGYDRWSMCQIQFNYMDIDKQAGIRGLKLAAARRVAVVVMEPLLGGRLAIPPEDIQQLMLNHHVQRSAAEWALDWLWDQEEVSLVLSGMSTMDQVEQNLEFADESSVGCLTPADQQLIGNIRTLYSARTVIPCTRCGYCMPCPNGVNIPGNFEIFNYAHTFDDRINARMHYKVFLKESERAAACAFCGVCEPLCPQQIEIPKFMTKVAVFME
jgi:hypothetical protein